MDCYENSDVYYKLMAYATREEELVEIESEYLDEEFEEPETFNIDELSGEEFEEFCAELLQAIGFEKVRLTPHSRDQGVDILAEKQGVKYAFQSGSSNFLLIGLPYNEHFAVMIRRNIWTLKRTQKALQGCQSR